MHRWLLLILLAALIPVARAQQLSTFWLSEGLGLGSEGIAVTANLSAGFGSDRLVSLRVGVTAEPGLFPSRVPVESIADVGVLYGRTWQDSPGKGHTSVAAGLAYVEGMRRGELVEPSGMGCMILCASRYEEKPFRTVGIPVEARIVLAPLRFLGIGVNVFGNLNPVRPFAGASLQVHIGKLR